MKYMCNKSYSCEKAFGGHLSSHKMAMDYVDDDDDDVPDDANYNSYDDAPDYYSLRKKVKGSGTGLDDSSVTLHLHHVCKECGKGFRSLTALCGHMACHSDKERHRYEFQAGDKHRRLFVDATAECSETADSDQMQPRRRSKRVSFMSHAHATTKLGDGFSFISGVMPVEEVARCLMMMSNDRRDAGCWGRVTDYSDSPSVESEGKPPSSGTRRSSEEILYEPKQRYKNLDTFKRGHTKKIKRGIAMATEEDAVAVTQEKKCNAKKRDNSRHECPICFRVFKSGQAMGGHKRSHFLQGGVEEAVISVVVTEKEVPTIDLNFPAFGEEGDDGGLFP